MLSQFVIAERPADLAGRVCAAIDAKTKPPRSLGRIETLALQMALAQNSEAPVADPARLLLFAGDHGLVADGVSAWPQAVTAQMVANFLSGGAAANAFAHASGAEITVVDAGVAHAITPSTGLVRAAIGPGTRSALHEDAMSADQCEQALRTGAELAVKACREGARVIALGDMGIGNTASASLIAHAVTGAPLAGIVGPGAGLDASGVARKTAILERCAARRPDARTGTEALAAFGGFEIAMMAGAVIGAASEDAAVLVDGFIASAAALAALTDRPDARGACIFAHRSAEPGHGAILDHLDADPLLDLQMRLGEGTGALLALPLARAACAMLAEMATFDSAGVSGKTP